MGDNFSDKGRIRIVDPNNFDYKYNNGVFSENNLNMTVPTEDLSIIVELKTKTKSRTILNTQDASNSKITSEGQVVSFIDGTTDKTTGNQDYLSTNYTKMNTQLDSVEEALGITNIDIDFNSSYAPMVNINFIDVKGAALFQPNSDSKFNVLFRLPYPLFELTIKGFYGKPVTYCLHMLKCNVRFNSQTGNFEIAAQFVGYTYAMLSDMIMGYLRAAANTEKGKEKLKARNIISINEFIKEMNNIDALRKDQLQPTNVNTNNLAIIKELKSQLTTIKNTIYTAISDIKNSKYGVQGESKNDFVVIVKNPTSSVTDFQDTDNFTTYTKFVTDYNSLIKDFNNKSGDFENLKIKSGLYPVQTIFFLSSVLDSGGPTQIVYDTVKTSYKDVANTSDNNVLTAIVTRLKDASGNLSSAEALIKYYDFSEINDTLAVIEKALETEDKNTSLQVAEDLKNTITSKLKFTPTIRNIVHLFTSHVEIFLELLFECSSQYKDSRRMAQLDIFKNEKNTSSKAIDVNDNTKKDGLIYPWPEYIENNEEKYLGSKLGPLKTPLDVPEIKFVEELYQAMLTIGEEDQQITNGAVKSWYSVSPADTLLNSLPKPYDRLDASANPDDVARLLTLRAMAFIGFANDKLSKDEIDKFAKAEGSAIIDKFINNQKIIQGLTTNYSDDTKYYLISGKINGVNSTILTESGNDLTYTYIDESTTDRRILPLDKGFNNVNYTLTNETASSVILSSQHCNINELTDDTAKYIEFIDSNTYESKSVASPMADAIPQISFSKLTDILSTSAQLNDVGFFANNGKYGTQEFSLINYTDTDYGISEVLPLATLFYDNTSKDNVVEGEYLSVICGRRKTETLLWDLTNPTFLTAPFDLSDSKILNKYNEIYENHDNIGDNLNQYKLRNSPADASYPFLEFAVNNANDYTASISLFGSRFYNAQNLNGKAFLLLHSFPWRGLYNQINKNSIGIFDNRFEILNMFQNRTGYIQVPKLFPAFIGGLLWRHDLGESTGDPIIFNVNNQSLIPGFDTTDDIPTHKQYLKYYRTGFGTVLNVIESNPKSGFPMSFSESYGTSFTDIEGNIFNLPTVVKDAFKAEFFKFVTEFDLLRKSLEIKPKGISADYDSDGNQAIRDTAWVNAWASINNSSVAGDTFNTNTLANLEANIQSGNGKSLTDTFKIVTYWSGVSDFENNFILEYKNGSDADKILKEQFFTYKYISNNTWRIWNKTYLDSNGCNGDVKITKDDFKTYITSLNETIKTKIADTEKKKFNSNENDQLKLELYRTLKKIYDKWIGNVDTADDIVFQCCSASNTQGRLAKDTANQNSRHDNTIRLIDSFRFVDRAFKDIGDQFQINPVTVTKMLLESTNNSFYDVIGRVLTENNFEFIALPNYIDYNDPAELKSVFVPYAYYEKDKFAKTGPSFVCVYVGQSSTKLDLGKNAEYPDDGFNLTDDTIPPDFTTSGATHEDVGAAFVVKYGHQNQSIFKDVTLDQSEFNETAESLQIMDQIANKFSQGNQAYVGQNLYNIYSVRSYKVEVEMMGDAMIQPMMYFQLDNIPMFRGAYLITRVRHNIKPNYMSTIFTGTRIKRYLTPMVDVATLYSSLLDNYSIPNSKAGSILTTSSNYVDVYYNILTNNIPKDSSGNPFVIEGTTLLASTIKTAAEAEITRFDNGNKKEKEMTTIIDNYFKSTKTGKYDGQSWSSAFVSFIMRTADANFPASSLHFDYVTKAMNGSYGYEAFPLKAGLKIKAEVGDILINPRSGDYISSHGNIIYKIEGGLAYLVGGNMSNSVKTLTVKLDADGYIPNNTIFNTSYNSKILLKRTNGKYYHGKELSKMQPVTQIDGKVYGADGTTGTILPGNKNIKVIPPANPDDIEIYKSILTGIGAASTDENLKLMYAWRIGEGGAASWNPFNTTFKMNGSTPYNCNIDNKGNPNPVRNYKSRQDGIDATVRTLKLPYYDDIRKGLIGNIGAIEIGKMVSAFSTWGTGYGVNKVLNANKLEPPAIARTTNKVANC